MKGKKSFKPKNRKMDINPESEGMIRLNKFIANAGICSRREADQLIEKGKIKVNGNIVSELGYKIKKSDKVAYNGRFLRAESLQYVLINKPTGYITTVTDPRGRRTVMDLIKGACEERIYPVGRLDRNTSGLLLMTNDGDFAKRLTHPSHKVKKIYQVTLDRPISKNHFMDILKGVKLEDGMAAPDEMAIVGDDNKVLGIEIHIGRNRIIRRIFEHMGYQVEKLDRVMFGTLTKKNLPRGKYRHLVPQEVMWLRGHIRYTV